MNNQPTTPAQSPPIEEDEVGGPGLFSAPRNPHAEMENPATRDEADSRSVSENSSIEHNRIEETSSRCASSRTGRVHDTTTTPAPSASKSHSVPKQPSGSLAMDPPPKPNFKATPTSAQPQHSVEPEVDEEAPAASVKSKRNGGHEPTTSAIPAPKESSKTASRKRSHGEINQSREADDDTEENEEFIEPANPIAPFDWMDLQSRYHQRVSELRDEEQELYHSFEELVSVRVLICHRFQLTNSCSTSSCGAREVTNMKWIAASSGTSCPTYRLEITEILTSLQNEDTDRACEAPRTGARKQTAAL